MKNLLRLTSLIAASAAFLYIGLGAIAQDIVTSEGLGGGSGGFVFKSKNSRKVTFGSTGVKRNSGQLASSRKRVTEQGQTIDRDSPKRDKSKEVDPSTVDFASLQFKRKTRIEAAVIFAGVGEYYLKAADIEKSLEFFREAAELDPNNLRASTGLSEALTRQGDDLLAKDQLDYAIAIYTEALSYNEKNASANAALGEIYSAQDQSEKAVEYYKKALAADAAFTSVYAPLGSVYFERGEIALADEFLSKAVAIRPDDADTQFYLGLVRFKQNRNDDALAALKRSADLNPQSEQAHFFLGEVYTRLDKDADAVVEYKKAVELKADYLEAWYALAGAYASTQKYDEAIAAYKKTVALKVNFGEAYANLGDVYLKKDMIDEAIAAFRLATTFITSDGDLYSRYAFAAGIRASDPRYTSFWMLAVENLKKAIALSPEAIDYSNLGWALYNGGLTDQRANNSAGAAAKFEEAKAALKKALEIDPKLAAAYLNLGMVASDTGDLAGAVSALKTASDLRKDWVPAINELGLAYVKAGKLDDALVQFQRTVEIDENFGSGYYNLAETLIRQNKLKDAKKHYERLKKLGRVDLVRRLELITGGAIAK